MTTKQMKVIVSFLEEARYHIDGGVNCHTHEYEALDKLERAMSALANIVHHMEQHAATSDNPSSVPVGYAYMPDAPAQTDIEAFRSGGAEAFEERWYWSSTQYAGDSGYAWGQGFCYGGQYGTLKDSKGRCRAVRRLKV